MLFFFKPVEIAQVYARQIVTIAVGNAAIEMLAAASDVVIAAVDSDTNATPFETPESPLILAR